MLLSVIVLPLCMGLLACLLPAKKRSMLYGVLCALQGIEVALLAAVAAAGEKSVHLFSLLPDVAVALHADAFGAFMGVLVGGGWLLVSIFAAVYMQHEGDDKRFLAVLFFSEAAVLGTMFADNLVCLYLFFELTTLCSMPLVLHDRSRESISAAMKYLFYSVAGALLALFGIFVLARYTQNLAFVPGGSLSADMLQQSPGLFYWAMFLLVVGFGAKAGMFPLHGWLPTAHPVAPAPASALLSGLITKCGVMGIFRAIYFVAGAEHLRGTWVQTAWLSLALLTVFMGSMMGYLEKGFKKRLAYSSVSQISYVLVGLFVLSNAGVSGAMLQILFHAMSKIGLFLCAGAVIYLTHKTRVDELQGLGRKMPLIFVGFTLLSLSLIGIPPFGGFVSKWYLAQAALQMDGAFGYIIPVVLLASALLTAGYLLPVTIAAFFPGKGEACSLPDVREPAGMYLPIAILALGTLLLGLCSQPLAALLVQISAVLG